MIAPASSILTYLLHYAIARTVYDWVVHHGGVELLIPLVVALLVLSILRRVVFGGGGRSYGGGFYRSRYYRERTKDLKEQRKSGKFRR